MEFQQINGYPKVRDFVAIDFETATDLNPCQIGMAIVKDGVIVKTISRLIRPLYNLFNSLTISIHHITPVMTERQPEFPEVWKDIKEYFDGSVIVAHNARFDMSVLKYALDTYCLPYPKINGYICTCDLNNREGLELACARYGICLEHHHDGEDDAINCAKLYLAYVNEENKMADKDLPHELFQKNTFVSFNPFAFEGHDALRGDVLQKDLAGADPNNPFYDRKLVITGIFNIDRPELAKILKSMGADIDTNVGCRTNYLLIGEEPGPSKLKKFDELIAAGKDVRKIYQEDLNLILAGKDYEKYHTELPVVSKLKSEVPKERKTTWPNLVKKFKQYVDGEDVEFTERELQSEDYRLLNLYYKQQQKVATTKDTVLVNLRELDEPSEYEFKKDILACFVEGEDLTKELAYERMQKVFTKYGLNFKAKTCVLTEFGVEFKEYKADKILHLTILHIPNL